MPKNVITLASNAYNVRERLEHADLVLEAERGNRLEEGAFPVGRHCDAGRAQGPGEAEQDLLGRAYLQ